MKQQLSTSREKIDKTDLFWLGYLVFFLIQPIDRRSGLYWVENLAIMAVFITLYVAFLRLGGVRLRLALLLAMYLLGAATMPFNGGGTSFIIYAAALLPFVLVSLPWLFLCLALESALVVLEGLHLHYSPYSWGINSVMILIVGGTNVIFAQKERADCKLRMQQEEIETLAAVAERERIARDLHDVLGHTLSVIVLKSELANRLLQRELDRLEQVTPERRSDLTTLQRAQTEISDVERTARTALAEVREAIGGYRARGLAAEIEAARSILASAGVSLLAEGNLQPAGLSAAGETVLALALREAVTNIVRHAEATACRLRLVQDQGRHRLYIEDNGQHNITREGNGLRGMRERVEALGGQLSLTRDTGTLLQIDLPQRAT